MKNYPSVKKAMENEQLSISSASKIQSFFSMETPDVKIRKEVIKNSLGKSKREVEKIIQEAAPQKKRSITITLNERLLKKLAKIQSQFDDCSETTAIEALLDEKIRELDARATKRAASYRESKNQRYITRRAKEAVFKEADNRCEGISHINKKRCNARTNLQIDHIKPIHIGGKSGTENLRILCFNCNQRSFKRKKIYSDTNKTLVPS
jgi:hypothetical protein